MLDMLQGTCYGQDLLKPDGSVEDLCKACCMGLVVVRVSWSHRLVVEHEGSIESCRKHSKTLSWSTLYIKSINPYTHSEP